jgi:hypothetical protein
MATGAAVGACRPVRWRRIVALAVAAFVLAPVMGASHRPARAEPATAATGWYVTSREQRAGIDLASTGGTAPRRGRPPAPSSTSSRSLAGTQGETVLRPVARRESSGPIPDSSLVVAANGPDAIARADAWWAEAVAAQRATFRTGMHGRRELIRGSPMLLAAGDYGFPTTDDDGRHPRTAIGWDAAQIWLVTVDGRRPGWSDGLTLVETAQLLRWLGATDALNLDGGGSTSFVGSGRLRNWPSGGSQRSVAAAVVLMPRRTGSVRTTGLTARVSARRRWSPPATLHRRLRRR